MGYASHISAYEVAYHDLSRLLATVQPLTYAIPFPSRPAAVDFRIRFGVFRNLLLKSKIEEEKTHGYICKGYKMYIDEENVLTCLRKDAAGHFPSLSMKFKEDLAKMSSLSVESRPINGTGPTRVSEYLSSESPASEDLPLETPPEEDKT